MRADSNFKNKKLLVFLLISSLLITIDRILKLLFFQLNPSVEFKLGCINILRIKVILNAGAAFGLLTNYRLFLSILSLIVVLLILIYLKKIISSKDKVLILSFLLIFSGAMGNLIDRIFYGEVIDFISVLNIPYFNLADALISVGTALIILKQIWFRKRK